MNMEKLHSWTMSDLSRALAKSTYNYPTLIMVEREQSLQKYVYIPIPLAEM